jgi:opacity protein-like surface antigen
MKSSVAVIGLLAVLVSSAGIVRAQRFELGLSVGALKSGDHTLPTLGTIKADTGFAYEANFAARLYNVHLAALYVEVPFAGTPNTGLTSSIPTSPSDYSSFFFTPGLKLKLLPVAPISPYGFVGAGFARFHSGSTLANGQPNTGDQSATRAAVDFGAGVDWKVFPFISVRGEVRDFYSGTPRFNINVIGDKQHNVLISGGFVFRF